MPSAVNHRKRSHRSQKQRGCFQGGRFSRISPTVGWEGRMQRMRLLGRAMARGREQRGRIGNAAEAAGE